MGLQWEGLGSFQYSFNRMGMCLFSLQGVGLSVHSPFRVATETTTFAMPETAIGRTIFCMCVYVCVYVRMYMYICVCVCVYVGVCLCGMYARIHVYMCVCVGVWCVCICVYVCVYQIRVEVLQNMLKYMYMQL